MKYQKSNAIVPASYWTTEIPNKPGLYLWEDPGTKQLEPSLVIINKDKRAWVDNTGRFCDLMGGRWTPLFNKEQMDMSKEMFRRSCLEWSEIRSHAHKVARSLGATEKEVEGDRHGVPSIEDLIDLIVAKAANTKP